MKNATEKAKKRNLTKEYLRSPEQYKIYKKIVTTYELAIDELISHKIPPIEARSFNRGSRLIRIDTAMGISFLKREGRTPKEVRAYHSHFTTYNIYQLMHENISAEDANPYGSFNRLYEIESFQEIINIIKKKLSPTKIYDFSFKKFTLKEATRLVELEVDPLLINLFIEYGYDRDYPIIGSKEELEILKLKNNFLKRTPFKLIKETAKEQDEYIERYEFIQKYIIPRIKNIPEVVEDARRLEFCSIGKQGIILREHWKETAYKISDCNLEEEHFQRLSAKLGRTKNIVNYERKVTENVIEIEYIKGKTLEKIVSERQLSIKKTLKYGKDIMNGLIEMRMVGIWFHRDLRPANIMIKETESNYNSWQIDRAVIIDLGIATTDKHSIQTNNRRYGSGTNTPNDLTSLGQIMYKMATGKHLFARSKSMGFTKCVNKKYRGFDYL